MPKKKLQYHAVFEPAEEGGYNVSFPQFPGCVTFGRTFEETKKKGARSFRIMAGRIENKPIFIGTLLAIIKQSKIPKGKFN